MARLPPFGSHLPWAEPSWYNGRPTPYYNESHVRLRDAMRKWTQENISTDKLEDWETAGKVPNEMYEKCASDGLVVPIAFGARIPAQYSNYPIIGNISPSEWNGFHDFILWDELFRSGALASVFIGLVVGAPPLKQYASQALQDKIFPEILTGKKRICLAITEPSCGSDVKALTTTAEKTPDGKHYVVNGEKKWITNGMYSDYFMTAVRTGGPGAGGISMLLIPRLPGIRTRPIKVGGGGLSATTFVMFEDVKVPAEYLIGKEGEGFMYTMSNFNHERLWIVFQALRACRVCLEDTMAWVQQREAFGKTLIEQPVVRYRFGTMARKVESLQAWTEQIIFELEHLSAEEGGKLLGGITAMLKVEAGQACKHVADTCAMLMGGLGLTTTGLGARVEALSRSANTLIVPGGSEDVLTDLGVREALKTSKAAEKARGKAKI
ncbi:acyl-CoA dehydrogenase-like protein [Saccharata proteae CBS 121410]|uniref:Acyl-CoA dehydrogenase-like protein n=1 Tax=Saccharata proteae CBS 121410 TaxID=1314787 RepID=A0A9P4HUR3_9PEZI|nr:acyl-CoA dehydrogenase-like protein [Saccharata proteae CBS 121410]